MIRFIYRNTNVNLKIHLDTLSTPTSEVIPKTLEQSHSSPLVGQSGFHRTYNPIKKNVKWANMKTVIKTFIKNCKSCQKKKIVREKDIKPMEITTTSSNPLEKIFLDIVGLLPLIESGKKCILTLQDDEIFTNLSVTRS